MTLEELLKTTSCMVVSENLKGELALFALISTWVVRQVFNYQDDDEEEGCLYLYEGSSLTDAIEAFRKAVGGNDA